MANAPSQLDRYHRQMLLPRIGAQGQQKLLDATALIVGCGALGSVIASTLARAGVGHLRIADRDFVEITNLQRQVLFDESDVEQALPKAEAARMQIARVNRQVEVTAIVDDVNASNVEKLAEGCDVILDGLDNFETRFLLNDVAVKRSVPYIYGGAVATLGMTFDVLPRTPGGDSPWERADRASPCMRCVFDAAPPPGEMATCDTAGVLGPVVSVIANLQACEAMKVLVDDWQAVNRDLVHVDLWDNSIHRMGLETARQRTDCPCCRARTFDHLEGAAGGGSTVLCGREAVQVLPPTRSTSALDLERMAERLRAHADVRTNRFMLRARFTGEQVGVELTLFPDGRAIVKGTTDPATARSVYSKYVGS
ncbi:MAG: thiamine biosynthesis protein ThiF [Phycisphaeraceae bacterium]|nr:thiamine biosynthesis protein ThiF [Phycisphaeraceae bacterium]